MDLNLPGQRGIDATRQIVAASVFPGLTPREHEVRDLMARGRSNTDISPGLAASDKTVRSHVSNLFA